MATKSDGTGGSPPRRKADTRVLVDPDETRLSVQRLVLRATLGEDAGESFTADADRLVVGTHPSAHARLTDAAVSGFHCEIAAEDGVVTVRDLGSRNGTWVDGVSVLEAHLRPGASLGVGRSQLRFEVGDDAVDIPLSAGVAFGSMVGTSKAMRRAFERLARAARSDATVLLGGETGTGKEAAAEAIHRESPRADGPFIVVDCGAIPAELLESELFGHERGAFTGAQAARKGAFQAADGGTIFLDEIGELPLDLQPRLLRALEQRKVKRVGANEYVPVDVRVIAATHRDLKREVNERRFRSDLYYRLAVLEVRLPSLRERPDDIPRLAQHLIDGFGASPDATAMLRTPAFLDELARHRWPGNVRELRNYLERCLALQEHAPLGEEAEAVPGHSLAPMPAGPKVDIGQPYKDAKDGWIRDFERQYLARMLEAHEGNVRAAARAAGLDRVYFYRLLWKHGLK